METKICRKCKLEKDINEFSKKSETKDGKQSICKYCDKQKSKEWKKNNKEKVKLQRKKYNLKNPEKIIEYQKKWAKKNPEKVKLKRKKYNLKNIEKNKDYCHL